MTWILTRQVALLLAGQEPGWRSRLLPVGSYPASDATALRATLPADFLAVSYP